MLKKILKSSSTFLGINVLSTLVQIALISIYVASFSPREYGVYALLSSFMAFMNIIASCNLSAAMQTYFFDFTDSKKQFSYLRSIFSIAILISVLVMVLLLVSGATVFKNLFQNSEVTFSKYGLIVFCNAAIASINYIYFEFLRNKQSLKEYGILMICQISISLSLQFLLIRYFRFEVLGAFWGLLISHLMIFLYIIITQKLITLHIDKGLVIRSLKYSLFLVPFLLVQWFMSRADRFIIESYIGLSEVGVYALMMNVAMIISLLSTSLLNSFRPTLFECFKQKEGAANKITLHFILYLGAITLISSILYLFVQNIDALAIDKKYYQIKPIIGLGLLLFGIRVIIRFFNEYLVYLKESKLLSLLTIFGFIVYAMLIFSNTGALTTTLLLKILIFSNLLILFITLLMILFQIKKQKSLH